MSTKNPFEPLAPTFDWEEIEESNSIVTKTENPLNIFLKVTNEDKRKKKVRPEVKKKMQEVKLKEQSTVDNELKESKVLTQDKNQANLKKDEISVNEEGVQREVYQVPYKKKGEYRSKTNHSYYDHSTNSYSNYNKKNHYYHYDGYYYEHKYNSKGVSQGNRHYQPSNNYYTREVYYEYPSNQNHKDDHKELIEYDDKKDTSIINQPSLHKEVTYYHKEGEFYSHNDDHKEAEHKHFEHDHKKRENDKRKKKTTPEDLKEDLFIRPDNSITYSEYVERLNEKNKSLNEKVTSSSIGKISTTQADILTTRNDQIEYRKYVESLHQKKNKTKKGKHKKQQDVELFKLLDLKIEDEETPSHSRQTYTNSNHIKNIQHKDKQRYHNRYKVNTEEYPELI